MTSTVIPQKTKSLTNIKPLNVKEPIKIKKLNTITIPNSIYKRAFNNLVNNNIVYILLDSNSNDGKCYWTLNAFSKNNKNKVNTIFSKVLMDCDKLKEIKNLYQKLNKIEKNVSVTIADKYLDGYLEYKNIELNNMFSCFLQSA